MKTITLELRAEDAEPILREAAFEAAKFTALWLYATPRTCDLPGHFNGSFDRAKAIRGWQERGQRATRIVEAFGVEAEITSEGETLTTYVPDIVTKSHTVAVAGMKFRHIDASKPDPNRKNWRPQYRRAIHEEACRQAAARVVRRWRNATFPAGRLLDMPAQ